MDDVYQQTLEHFDKLLKEQMEETWPKLCYFIGRNWPNLESKLGSEPGDVIMEAINDTRQGIRTWPLDDKGEPKNISLFWFLANVVRSILNNKLRKVKDVKVIPLFDQQTELDVVDFQDARHEPADEWVIRKELREKLYEAIGDDPEVVRVVNLLREGLKPQEIAEELGMEIRNVRKAQKRLDRRIEKLRARLLAPTG